MKDIYSPLEIDEEWDQRAPDMGSNEGGGTAVAIDPAPDTATNIESSSDMGTSTLPPEQAIDTSVDTSSAPMAGEAVEPTGDMAHDPAHDVAEAAVNQSAPVVEPNTPVSSDTLDINDMNSSTEEDTSAGKVATDIEEHVGGEAAVPENGENTIPPEADSAEPTKINVMGDAVAEEAAEDAPEAGSVIEPQVKPEGMEDELPEPAKVEPESKEEPEEHELPASPVVEAAEPAEEESNTDEGEDAPELKTFKDRLEQQRQANIEAALKIKARAEEMRKREQSKADEAMARVEDADREITEIEDELTALGYKEAA